ncbi:MAG: energy-coupling factor ABC transporter ATP-binding protein [Treponema sp.]|jgi:energy-coupling factor transport system ATP-binding protein|nr:energy-coupling factor ABC transporter ATP-binding protein [Treponema sp.]
MSIIKFDNVSFKYSRSNIWALRYINLEVIEGEFLALMGRNNSGKSTLCKLINGIIPHSQNGKLLGKVIVDGQCTENLSVQELAVKAGMVLDDPDIQLFTHTVFNEAAFGPENLLLPVDEIKKRVNTALTQTCLLGLEDRKPVSLSGGEKMRLSIAAALSMNGKILVLDEPLSRLDSESADKILSVLKEISNENNLTVIMACHESDKVLEYADRVCVLENGHLSSCDTAQKIFADNELVKKCGIASPSANKIKNIFINSVNNVNEERSIAIEIKKFGFFFSNSESHIKNINLTVFENDFIAIMGPNGCGKTTLLKNITGLLRPNEGDILIHGKNTKELDIYTISKEAGFVMQNPEARLFSDTVYNEAAFALKNSNLPRDEINKRVEFALSTVGLFDFNAFPHVLSKIDRLKLVLACVLVTGCKIIMLDEPDVGQDYEGCIEIMEILKGLNSHGYTIIFVTHNESLACDYSKRIAKMNKVITIYEKRPV